jgi:hypothetical protein
LAPELYFLQHSGPATELVHYLLHFRHCLCHNSSQKVCNLCNINPIQEAILLLEHLCMTQNILLSLLYRVSQEKRPIFWEVIILIVLSKKVYLYMCPILNGFHDIDISLYSSKTVDKKYYVPFLIPVFIVEVTMLVQFT